MKINPNKCVFRVNSAKFLGHTNTTRGIEADLAKIIVVADMPPLKSQK